MKPFDLPTNDTLGVKIQGYGNDNKHGSRLALIYNGAIEPRRERESGGNKPLLI